MKKVRFCLEKEALDGSSGDQAVLPLVPKVELACHKSADDCWIAIHGKIYNVSGYLSKHPGGSQVMLKMAGKDATAQFDDVGHSLESLMFDLGPEACVGVLRPSSKPRPTRSSSTSPAETRSGRSSPPPASTNASLPSSKWEQLRIWQKTHMPLGDQRLRGSDAHPHGAQIALPGAKLRPGPPHYDAKNDEQVCRFFSTAGISAVMTICIIILLYVKLRCPSMFERVVSHTLPEDLTSETFEIPAWSI
ncbi:LADA_0A05446g1_1 [Lachancea dasiensis]|uniref:LADA_0A05446g1_1 n=1 Tax=Lachancea dasiensis TaxID=1072105 RepID=A0A1G4IP10_9SACH|nr:LADA_0A05446g1_1 [Lachancea dasiensis]